MRILLTAAALLGILYYLLMTQTSTKDDTRPYARELQQAEAMEQQLKQEVDDKLKEIDKISE